MTLSDLQKLRSVDLYNDYIDNDNIIVIPIDSLNNGLQIYNKKKDDTVTISKAVSLMAPYTIAFTILWLTIVIIFYFLGVPIGIGTGVTL